MDNTSRLQVRGRYHSICDSRCSRLKHSDEGWDELKLVVPNCVPIDATEIEVYVTVQSGWQPGGVSWMAEVCVYTQQAIESGKTEKFEKRLLFHPYANCPVWICNSENMTLPLTQERIVHVYITPNPPKIVYKWGIDICAKIVGYRN